MSMIKAFVESAQRLERRATRLARVAEQFELGGDIDKAVDCRKQARQWKLGADRYHRLRRMSRNGGEA